MPPPAPAPAPVPAAMVDAVLAWYDARGRTLPFRGTTDPYAILVSEVMAQQTRISRVAEAWRRFVDRFPSVEALAGASPADVLRAWRGMGYDRRALNLRRAARAIVERHGGRVPGSVAELEALPGVGPYTARAVAAIAFGRPVGAVDTNVRRVLGRALAGAPDGLPPRRLQAAADASVPAGRPADWTHAVMDVGATLCRSRQPACEPCPARPWCAYAAGATSGAVSGGSAMPGRAARTSGAARAGRASPPFASTTRWLRGRIMDRLRDGPADGWTAVRGPIGGHGVEAVREALAALAAEGLVELDGGRPDHGRLPIA